MNVLTTAISDKMGTLAVTLATVKVQSFGDQEICLVEVQASPDPIYTSVTGQQDRVFYVRVNNSTRQLKGPDLVGYVIKRWG